MSQHDEPHASTCKCIDCVPPATKQTLLKVGAAALKTAVPVFNRNHGTKDIPMGAVYIGRGSRWGNPYVIGINGDRAAVIEMYKHGVAQASEGRTQLSHCFPTYKEIQEKLRNKSLVCFCAPEPCHGHFLHEIANGPCVNCSNGSIVTNEATCLGDWDKAKFDTCPVCKGDSRQ